MLVQKKEVWHVTRAAWFYCRKRRLIRNQQHNWSRFCYKKPKSAQERSVWTKSSGMFCGHL